VKPQDNKV